MTPAIVGYLRLPAEETEDRHQLEQALNAEGCQHITIDIAARNRDPQPERDRLLAELAPASTLVIPALTHLARSMTDLLQAITTVTNRGVALRALRERLDTSDDTGIEALA